MATFRDLSPQQIEAIRQQFVSGGKPAKIGEPFALSGKQVSDYACKHQWKVEKAKVSEELAEKSPGAIADRLIAKAVDYVAQHTEDWQALRDVIMKGLSETATVEDIKRAALAAEFAKSYKHVQAGQRLSLGLDKDKPPEPPKNDDKPAIDASQMDDAELAAFIGDQIRCANGG